MTNSLRRRTGAALADELTIHRSFYRYCSETGDGWWRWVDARAERARKVDVGEREGRLTAFITAFSPCHGFSLRHSLQAIERQAICLLFALFAALHA